MKKIFFFLSLMLASTMLFAGENDLLWDYTSANIPTTGPDNGLYYGSYVNDAAGTNLGLHGVKLNSSGWAYFEKAPVAGTLKLTISNRKTTDGFKVDVYNGSLVDGTPTKGTLIATTDEAHGAEVVSVELDETVTGVYITRNTGAEGVLCKVEFVETVARTFTDFQINFRSDPYIVVAPAEGLPSAVTVTGGSFHDGQHGYQNATLTVAVDGPVKFTIGGCGYSTKATVSVDGGAAIDIDTKTAGCDNNTAYDHFVTYTYKGGAATLSFNLGAYCPYFFAEAVEIRPATLIVRDQNDRKLGEYEMEEGDVIGELPDSLLAKVTIPAGMKFRGWKYGTGKLFAASDILAGNTTISAAVSAIEQPATGTHYKFNLNSATDYMSDHDLIASVGSGAYHDNQHGWVFGNGDEMLLIVSPKAYVSVGLCTYSATADQVIRNAAGVAVDTMHTVQNTTADGALCSFYYANANNVVDTLHFEFTATTYIHFVEVYNVAAPLNKVGHVYDIAAGDAGSLMLACAQLQDGDTIQLHDGVYDFGETALTTISANHIVVRGESMDGTIIKNAPDVKKEGIGTTATILNTGNDNVFENLTLQNALDYYSVGTGRAVCLQDKGTRTACYNVKMLSYQDTYYSNKPGQQCWFEDCEIHGTVDFICGSGSVYFYNTLLYCESRSANGNTGDDCITANNSQTAQGDKGYVFDRCTIQSACPIVSLGRAWNDQPMTAYLLTKLDYSVYNFTLSNDKINRWTIAGMNVCAYEFAEYNTMDMDGNVVSPESNNITFTHTTGNKTMETIINYEAAEAKSYTHFFRDGWSPARNYVDFPSPNTAVENIVEKAAVTKYFQNGVLVIEKDGVRYNALGVKL